METEKEEAAEQAKDVSSKENAPCAMKVTDKFMSCVFKIVKVISALVVLVCIATMVGTLLYYIFKGSGSIDIPDFDDMKPAQAEKAADGEDAVQNAVFKELRKEYGSKVDDLIEVGSLDSNKDYTRIIEILVDIDENMRSAYIKGAISFMKDAKSYMASKEKDKKFTGDDGREVFKAYNDAFNEAQKAAALKKVESDAKRYCALWICGISLVGMVLFLIIPLLLRIEENTRK